jgi:hypothetical protein
VTVNTSNTGSAFGLSLRHVAIAGVAAVLLGRALGPALRGAREGLDHVILYTDLLGSAASYLFAFAAMAALGIQIGRTVQDRKATPVYRSLSVALGAGVLLLTAPALRHALNERASIVLGTVSGLLALVAAREALPVGRTRAVGLVLGITGLAALLHVTGSTLAWYAGERALYRLALSARWVATAGVAFDAVAVLGALTWISTRNRVINAWATRICLLVAMVIVWGAVRGARENAPLWQVVAHRALDRLLATPTPYVWLPLRHLLEATAPLLGLVAIATRRQIPSVMASIALVLVARPTTDVPLSALAIALAALSVTLAAHDDKSMWATVDGTLRPIT